ncbi:BON domain-containing protein [Ensifer sp. ENS09]|uniref:BON domain-containing protein n=1 Tax=Ensifer sp. ENS09 TaxID=2769263 RepID=UPI00177B8621|nr:BON domain-containing protein [Ensifer sp. ENS09]MBD9649874.1 BON domain-containing protein [Ensifer sp. ENS09]
MISDTVLRQEIIDELDFESAIDGSHIGVAVEDGIVTLTGCVFSSEQKALLESLVCKVRGVRGIAEEVEVRPLGVTRTTDEEIARRMVNALACNAIVPSDTVQIKVEGGWVTLVGTVDNLDQSVAAENVAHALAGVGGVTNKIEVTGPTIAVGAANALRQP